MGFKSSTSSVSISKSIMMGGWSANIPHAVKQVFWIFSSPFLLTLVCLIDNVCTLQDILSSWLLLWFWILIAFVSQTSGWTHPCRWLFCRFQICFLLILYLGISKHPAEMYLVSNYLIDWISNTTGVLHLGQLQKRSLLPKHSQY